ncbi:GNAT family N-acetyltransferase [Flavimobilis sp. GY10621]|uniref:GNAT family N-acetyltransferase n=1 Tax=Flavimobilis rhizosphaerae TaxID=2775421 RepID=A0ABR9DVC1_9MICO|nr:GNAT family protein [Flavimobilis rhizosphaerae]MBD9699955.1 GNAT family N-acetyltransferase [Flavimobilis rhizosphaerae]
MVRGPELAGELVRLRPFVESDAERAWELVQDTEGLRLTGTTASFTREQIAAWVRDVPERPGRYDWAITSGVRRDGELVSDEMLGEIVLNDLDDDALSANLRLNMLPNYRGRGYGREAIRLVLGHAFAADGLGLHRVSLDVLDINPRAQMLYESIGFTVEGRLREVYRDGDRWTDAIVMSILEHEWETDSDAA